MGDKLQFVKENVKVSVTVVALGMALTLGYAKGCSVDVKQEKPVAAPVTVPAAPASVP